MRRAEPSDADLLASGSAVDFGCFYDRHVDAVVAFVARRAQSPEVVFDLAAETFARALERRRQYDADRGPAVAWLLGIARNLIVDAARRGQVEATSRLALGMAPVELDDDQLAAIAQRGRTDLRDALAGMPAEQREAVIRRVVFDERYEAIASDLRCSEQVVRKRVSRGLVALRASLEGHK
jgi:RNA polymerase sigma-70 factor (ECF subfamily)